jgi:arabinan endo-1,5-alpha-L-arabinosidase
MKSALAVSAILTALTATADAYANPLSCSGTCTNAHDPSLVRRDDGTYFRFSTGGKVAVHTAPSIQGPWTYKGAALPNGSKINKAGNQDLWAPDVSKVGNTYYLYYSVSSFGSQDSAVGVATSTTMDVGSWTDLGSTGVESVAGSKFNAIDGNLQSANGKLYMNFGSFWSDLFQIEMTATPTKVAKAVTSATQIAFVPTSPQAQEAAFGYKYGNYYYLFFSVGSCCGYDSSRPAAGKEYKIQACRSSSVSGPFVSLLLVWCAVVIVLIDF